MADIQIIRKKPEARPDPVEKIILTLTPEQAIVLHTIFNNIGGEPKGSARMYVDEMNALLKHAQVPEVLGTFVMEDLQSSIYFRNNSHLAFKAVAAKW